MGDFDLSRVSDPTEVLLARAEVRLESLSIWDLAVPNGTISLEEYKIRREVDGEYEAYFKSKNNQTIVLGAVFWGSIILPLLTAHELSVDKLTAVEACLLFPFLLIGILCLGALTSMPVDHIRMKHWEKRRLEELGLQPAKAMVDETNGELRRAYRLLSFSLERLRNFDLSVDLELSLEDVEREFHLHLGRWQETTDRTVREGALKRLKQLAIQTSALYEAEDFKARAQEAQVKNALEEDGVDLSDAIRSAAEDVVILAPSEVSESLELENRPQLS